MCPYTLREALLDWTEDGTSYSITLLRPLPTSTLPRGG